MRLICKIIEQKGEKMLVEIEKQIITLPATSFPQKVKAGEQFHLSFWNSQNEVSDKNLAKNILEEILNGK